MVSRSSTKDFTLELPTATLQYGQGVPTFPSSISSDTYEQQDKTDNSGEITTPSKEKGFFDKEQDSMNDIEGTHLYGNWQYRLSNFLKELWSVGVADKQNRLLFADSLRIVAAICLLTSSVISSSSSSWPLANSLLYPLRSQWGFALFFVLIGRSFVSRWIVPQNAKTNDGSMKETGLSQLFAYQVGQALLLRPFRFFLPVIFIMTLQRKVCEIAPAFSDGLSYALRKEISSGWCVPSSNVGLITRIVSLFTVNDLSHLQDSTAMLYMTPLLFQGSLYAVGVTSFTSFFRNTSRTALLIFLAIVNWTTYSFLFPIVLGIIIADISQSGFIEKVSVSKLRNQGQRSFVSLLICTISTILFAILLFVPKVREPVSDGLQSIQTLYGRAALPSTTSGYHYIRFCDCVSAAILVFLVETLGPVRYIFDFHVSAFFGRHLSAALVVLHPIVLYGAVPNVFKSFLPEVEQHLTPLILKIWFFTFFITLLIAIPFRITIEIGSTVLGKLFVLAFLP